MRKKASLKTKLLPSYEEKKKFEYLFACMLDFVIFVKKIYLIFYSVNTKR